ncbi:protein kinase domain-containing protein [Nocardia sp. IBHARD005]|uniref:protein kinase domain-containing protein n=1 Tax=Nocardia sp. IBHARD005 TaxID=3457765 RepID=UPI0040587B0D
MSESTGSGEQPDETAGRATNVRVDMVEAFATAWGTAAERPPEIAEFLPDAATLRAQALHELIRVDLRQRWLHHTGTDIARKRLIHYCAEFPELDRARLPAGLVFEEFVIRRHSGERIDPRDYLREYPEQAASLRGLLNTDELDQSTHRSDDLDATMNQTPDSTRNTQVTSPHLDLTATATSAATVAHSEPGEFEPLDRIEVGQRIGDFELLTGLGAGAFARVFLARQTSMQRLVAVKISADRGTEPQTLAQLDHDYIVRVFDQRLLDTDSAPSGSRRLRLLYMQFLPGGTLLGLLRWVRETPPAERSGKLLLDAVDTAMAEKGEIRPTDSSVRSEIAALSWPETVAWLGRRLAEALDYAAAHGVLHRDVKPANVLLTAEGVPKLADFNISFSRTVAGTSPVAYFGGSLSYMSPEQLEACHPGLARTAADLDTRSDIFSLGVVLWELLTGAKPFDDSTAEAEGRGDETTLEAMLERRTVGVDPAALDRVPADCPTALRRVLLTCLDPDRSRRWADGAVLAKQFDLCLDARARDLVDPPPKSWRMQWRKWPLLVMILAIGVPNALASWYNIVHNQNLVVSRLSETAQQSFVVITAGVNVVFFPLGAAVLIYLARFVLSVPRGLRHGRRYDPEILRRTRHDTLRIGDRVVIVVFSLWAISGLTFPIALQFAAGDVPSRAVVHFLASLLVCGAIAVAYPFFLVTFYLVRCIYPIFLRHGEISTDDSTWLRALSRRCTWYLAIAASVPLLAVAGVTFLPPGDIPAVIVAVRVLCVGGIFAFVASYLLFRALEADLKALERVVS